MRQCPLRLNFPWIYWLISIRTGYMGILLGLEEYVSKTFKMPLFCQDVQCVFDDYILLSYLTYCYFVPIYENKNQDRYKNSAKKDWYFQWIIKLSGGRCWGCLLWGILIQRMILNTKTKCRDTLTTIFCAFVPFIGYILIKERRKVKTVSRHAIWIIWWFL